MRILTSKFVFFFMLVLAHASTSATVEDTELPANQGEIKIEVEGDSLSLETNNAFLHEVIREIGELAGFKTILTEDFVEPPLLNVSFKNMPITEAVERLISDKNRIIFYKRIEEENGHRNISQVWLLGPSGELDDYQLGDEQAVEYKQENTIASAEENVVKGHKLIKFTKMLQEDQQVQVRTWAAIALGKLKNKGAVFALESALLDQNALVRSEAINALGQIGGERSTMVLGNILLNSGADIPERVLAAKALWQLDSETAKGYLRAGAYDIVNPVRMASSNPSSSSKSGASNNSIGNTAAQ